MMDLEKLSKHLHETTPDRLAEKEIIENAEAIKATLERGESYQLQSMPVTIRRSERDEPTAAPTGTPTDRKTLAEVYAHEYAYNLHPDEPSLAALFLKFTNECTSRFAAAPTGTGEGSERQADWEVIAQLRTLQAENVALRSQLEMAEGHIEILTNIRNQLTGELAGAREEIAELKK